MKFSEGGIIVVCGCHVTLDDHYAEKRRRACSQCRHRADQHTDEPGEGCLTAECLCLNTPALI